ncbi:MAG TPA: PAS domain S-box protein [Verrucomicrobiae bacterium]|jgi:PAS domain S-box-containing protein|nr:PAS domain S-box protein [Verrucomicrobiae bacterium]
MSKPLRILMLEDCHLDAELVQGELRKAFPALEILRAQNEEEFTAALKDPLPDLILSDYNLPTYSGPKALRLVRARCAEIPFISISGSIGEERLVEMIHDGAVDYVPKNNLAKLLPAVQRALREVENSRHRRQAEESLRHSESRFRAIFEGASTGIAVEDLDGHIIETNTALQQMLGYTGTELQTLTRQDFTHTRDHREDRAQYDRLLSGDTEFFQVEKRFVRKDGRILWGRLTVSIVREANGKPQFSLVMIEDITERQRVEEAHLQNAAIVEFSNDAIISKTFDGVIFSWNPAAERVYGFTAQEANGRSASIILPPDREREFERILERIKQGEHIDNFETTRIRKDGSIIHVSMTTSPIKDVSGKIIGASSISRDITGRKQAEAALRESEENYRKLVELSPDGIFIQCEGKYVYLNSAAIAVTGARTQGQIIGKGIFDIIHPDYHEVVQDHLKLLHAGEDVPLHEIKLIRVDGGLVDVEATATPFIYRGKQAFQVVMRDITSRKRAEQALRKSEAGLARAQRIARLGNWELDLRNRALAWSDETYRIFGLNRAEHACTNELFYSCVHPDDRETVRQSVAETLKTGKPYGVDHRIILPGGEIKTVNEQAEVILDERGVPIRLLGTVLDITERKRAENLSHSFAKLGQRLSSATSAQDAAQIIADVADKLFGWDACNLLLCSGDLESFKSIFNMDLINGERCAIAPSNRAFAPSPRMRAVLEKGAQLILRDSPEIKPGETHPFGDENRASASALYVPVRNGAKIIGVFSIHSYCQNAYTKNDLETLQALGDHCGGALERIRAEVENQKLAAFPQFNPNPVMELAPDGTINYFNEAARQMAQSLGKNDPSEFLPPETAAFVKECLMTGTNKLRIQTVIQNRTISWSFFPIQTIGVVHCYAGDVTDRQNLEAQLRQAQKMESVGQLAGGIAHDFNNILTVIQGHGSLLSMSPSLTGDAKDSAQQIGLAAERAANLTRQLLTFSRRQIIQPKNLDFNDVVNNMTKMLRRLLGEDISLQVSYTPSLPLIHADPGMMEQILLNLSINARDAMPKGGKLFINTSLATVDRAYAELKPEATPGDYVRLTVKDTGTGIPPEILPHIFEPFFTTKDIGKGTGLGLATVYGIVQQHHGWITASSTLNTETVFQIFLPVVKGARAGAAGAIPAEPKVHGGKETILVVEDEPPLRVLVRSVLERYGYRVLEAVSGVAALSVWETHKDEIQLLLTDMVMPHGLSGQELGKKLLAEKPELKIIYCSGYSLAMVGTDMVLQEGLNFLQKPYHPRKLAQAIRDCLDGSAKLV